MRVGELARAAGLTVRTLYHYDELGLVRPSGRTPAGHRRYSPEDVQRLYRVVALRALGFALRDIPTLLDSGGAELLDVVQRQLEQVERALEVQEDLRRRLVLIRDQLAGGDPASTDDLMTAMEMTIMHERYYTKEQLEQLEQRAKKWGPEAIERSQRDWAELIAEVEAERLAGTDPADPKVQDLARRWTELIEQFTGGDPAIFQSLQRMYETEGPDAASRGTVNPETMAYAMRALELRGSA